MKDTDRPDVLAIETLLAAHAEKSPPPAHDPPSTSAAPHVHVAPPISVAASIPPVEPPLGAPDTRDIPVGNGRSSEIKIDALKPPAAQPTSKWGKRLAIAALALFGATAAAAYQQYSDQAKAMAAEWTPPFVLAALHSSAAPAAEQSNASAVQANAAERVPAQQPAAAAAADQSAPAVITATTPAAEPNQLQSMAQDLAAMGQQVEELKATIAQLKASQTQMARELAKASDTKASEAKASEAKAAETRPVEPTVRPKISALTAPPAQRPASPPPVRKPKPVVSTYSPAYAPAPVAAAPIAPPPPQAAAALPPPPPAQAMADDGQPVVRPPMPLR
ncbi:hypothetical protein [Bradyrhizobium roseum]|uniref:hypothetical protein n=1 Tax=Bradyrhizobium roseum TaxID=3056648 RepID=UPI002605E1E2|nr:hypothetical protein [Bradyrhizobium roseus]WKA25830.1 hypothetical protein QUH67_19580 [Bradyrhizobium roseus]